MIFKSKQSTLKGTAQVPASKSHTMRAIFLATMSEGKSVIRNPLFSLDTQSALSAAEAFGAKITTEPDVWTIEGRGKHLMLPENYIECGNSGSVSAFCSIMAGLVDGYVFVTGDASIRRRPISAAVQAINDLGGQAFFTHPESKACPIIVRGVMQGGQTRFDGLLSQMISGILLVAPLLKSDTEIFIDKPLEIPYLQMTLDWIARHGVQIDNLQDFKHFRITGGQSYRACETTIAHDWSGVAFPLVAGVVTESEVVIDSVDFQDSQGDKAVVDYLIEMGADITKDVTGGRILVRGGKKLSSGVTLNLANTPDALPALCVAAAYADGETTFTGLAPVRLKETDRVAVMQNELGKMGAKMEAGPDHLKVYSGHPLTGTKVESHHDHRIAMAMAISGFFAQGETQVNDAECVAVTYPNFFEVMEGLGANIERT